MGATIACLGMILATGAMVVGAPVLGAPAAAIIGIAYAYGMATGAYSLAENLNEIGGVQAGRNEGQESTASLGAASSGTPTSKAGGSQGNTAGSLALGTELGFQ
jgi:hypothetical protein